MVFFTFSESNHVTIDKLVKALESQREKLQKNLKISIRIFSKNGGVSSPLNPMAVTTNGPPRSRRRNSPF